MNHCKLVLLTDAKFSPIDWLLWYCHVAKLVNSPTHIVYNRYKLPKLDSGAVWKVGSIVETIWNVRANHGTATWKEKIKVVDPLVRAYYTTRALVEAHVQHRRR